MLFPQTTTRSAAIAAAVAALAWLPSPAAGMILPPPPCERATEYSVQSKSATPVLGSTHSLVAMTCDGTGGACTLGASYTYTVSVGFSIGATLNPDPEEIAGTASLGPSFSYSSAKGTGSSANLHCPDGPWICAIQITPWVEKVSGQKQSVASPSCGDAGHVFSGEPYTAEFPQMIDHMPNVNAVVCSCPNGPAGSTKAKGAPPVCFTAC